MDTLIQKLSNCYAVAVVEKLKQGEDKKEEYAFGASILLGAAIKGIILLSLSWLLGIVLPTIITAVSFAVLRIFAGGFHADTYKKCITMSTFQFLVGGWTSIYIAQNISNTFIQCIPGLLLPAGIYFIIRLAPTDTPNKRLSDENDRSKLKNQSMFVVIGLCATAHLLAITGYTVSEMAICIGGTLEIFTLTKIGHKVYSLWR